jgi:crossover junction endodeoxyribonuclease RuvC
MIVLGIDPGIANTGYGIVSSSGSRLQALEFGVIETGAATAPEHRLAEIHADAGRLISRFDVDAVAVEDLYFGANVVSAMAVGQARGVVLLAAGQQGVPVRAYTPQQVKAAVCGSGRADKAQVGRMVARLLGMAAVPRPDHAADALAVALCDVNRAPLAGAIAGALA